MIKTITGGAFHQMMRFAAAALDEQRQAINDLNVFPVPDGDTGTNMCMTMHAAVAELDKVEPSTAAEAVKTAAAGLLRGARGNSGVILSLLFRGMSKTMKTTKVCDGRVLAAAMNEGVATAYGAVMKPAEGTVLTVSRLAAQRAAEAAGEKNEAEYVLQEAIKAGQVTLQDTVEMNPVLKKAGVVDAGGKGYMVILEGMLRSLRGEELPEIPVSVEKADFKALSQADITFTFDTVFTVRKNGEKSLEPLRLYLSGIGDSLVIGEDEEHFKIHVHTDTPGIALTEAQKYGTLELAKIENMRLQAADIAAGKRAAAADDLERAEEEPKVKNAVMAAPRKKHGFLAVCAGEGMEETFRALGVDTIVSGGQTMNPSTENILAEVNRTPSEVVFILPNNKNIIMAAQQCGALTEKRVVVIPTGSVPQGIAAMMTVDGTEESTEQLSSAMEAAARTVTTAQVTYAARSSDFDGFHIKEGDYLVLLDGKLFATGRNVKRLLNQLAKIAAERDSNFINIYTGADVDSGSAAEVEKLFTKKCPEAEVAMVYGGQPVYYYVISFE